MFFKFYELLKVKLPKWVLLENVPGLLNSNSGKDFQLLIQKLDELGYCVAWKVFDAKYFGTPQRRRRVFILCSYGEKCSAEVLFEYSGSPVVNRQGLGKRKPLPEKLHKALETHLSTLSNTPGLEEKLLQARKQKATETTEKPTPLTQEAPLMLFVRRMLPSECETLQGFPKNWTAVDGLQLEML